MTIAWKRLGLGLGAALIAAGCSTPYQEKGLRGGYSETLLRENVIQVRFQGNARTPRQRVFDCLLYRCAELTDSYGYDYFIVLDGEANQYVRSYVFVDEGVPQDALDTDEQRVDLYGRGQSGPRPAVEARHAISHEAVSLIAMRRGSPPPGHEGAFVADEVLSSLRPYVLR